MSKIYWSWSSWSSIQRSLRFIWQNVTRGWNDSDCWGLDYTFAVYILPRLKRFRELHCSHPHDLTYEEYMVILDKMILAFQLVSEYEYKGTPIGKDAKAIQQGLRLFAKYYQHLWD